MKVPKLSPRGQRILLTISCSMALVALALMVWSILDPRPIPVVLAMSLGQAIGTISMISFLAVVGDDLRKARVILEDDTAAPAPGQEPPSP